MRSTLQDYTLALVITDVVTVTKDNHYVYTVELGDRVFELDSGIFVDVGRYRARRDRWKVEILYKDENGDGETKVVATGISGEHFKTKPAAGCAPN